jgi:hypothetical protein
MPRSRSVLPVLVVLLVMAARTVSAAGQSLERAGAIDGLSPSAQCEAAIGMAERRYGLPAGLLAAISRAETGRPDPTTRRLTPWPWSVQSDNRGLFFPSKAEAIAWVRAQQALGVVSVDTGCMQVNLFYHPAAFESLDAAFDPRRNADYAARFLLELHALSGDWRIATGYYHSQTKELAAQYVARVQTMLDGRDVAALKPALPSRAEVLARAWQATVAVQPQASRLSDGQDWSTLRQLNPRQVAEKPTTPRPAGLGMAPAARPANAPRRLAAANLPQ